MSTSNAINKEPFKTQDGYALASTAPKEIPWLAKGLFLEVGTTNVCAKPKTGKSSESRVFAVSVAEGRPYLGREVKQGNVLLFTLEGPLGAVQQHFEKLSLTQNNGVIRVVEERMPNDGVVGMQRLEATIEDVIKQYGGLKLVIVDPLAKLVRMPDPNDPVVVGPVMEDLESIAKKYQLQLMFLLHAKKVVNTEDPFDGIMNSTMFRAGVDTNFGIFKAGNGKRTIRIEHKWGVGLDPTELVWDPITMSSSLGSSAEELNEIAIERREQNTGNRIKADVLAALKQAPAGLNTNVICESVTGKGATKLEVLAGMVAAGELFLRTVGTSKTYSLTPLNVEADV